MNDPATTWPDARFDYRRRSIPSETTVANTLHAIVYSILLLVAAFNAKYRRLLPYSAAVLAEFVLFCTLLRWQPWASRLHLPLFICFSPIAGIVLSQIKFKRIVIGLQSVLIFTAIVYVIFDTEKPMIGLTKIFPQYPESILTTSRLKQIDDSNLEKLMPRLSDPRIKRIGLKCGNESLEYHLWALTRRNGLDGPQIEHVDVQNISTNIRHSQFKPDIVVVMSNNGDAYIDDKRHL
jgi:hypothetical protein